MQGTVFSYQVGTFVNLVKLREEIEGTLGGGLAPTFVIQGAQLTITVARALNQAEGAQLTAVVGAHDPVMPDFRIYALLEDYPGSESTPPYELDYRIAPRLRLLRVPVYNARGRETEVVYYAAGQRGAPFAPATGLAQPVVHEAHQWTTETATDLVQVHECVISWYRVNDQRDERRTKTWRKHYSIAEALAERIDRRARVILIAGERIFHDLAKKDGSDLAAVTIGQFFERNINYFENYRERGHVRTRYSESWVKEKFTDRDESYVDFFVSALRAGR